MHANLTRRHPRADFQGSVAFCRNGEARVVRPTNIAPGGVAVLAEEPLAPRTLVTLRLAMPGEKKGFTVLGRVVRAQPQGTAHSVAVEFLDLLPSMQARVAQFVAAFEQPLVMRAG